MLLVAALAAVATLPLLAALRREPLETAPPLHLNPGESLRSTPAPLPPVAPVQWTRPANRSSGPPERTRKFATLRIQLIDGPAPTDSVIGVLDGETTAPIAVLPATSPVRFEKLPFGRHWLVLSISAKHLRHSYLIRQAIEISEPNVVVDMNVKTHAVHLQLKSETAEELGDVRVVLRRQDDLLWHHAGVVQDNEQLDVSGIRVTDTHGRLLLQDLGPGTYVVETHGFHAQTQPQVITVPVNAPVIIVGQMVR